MGTSLTELIRNPARATASLTAQHAGIVVDRVVRPRLGGCVLDMTFSAPPELAVAGYETERGRVSFQYNGEPLAFPLGPERRWKHRYPSPLGDGYGYFCAPLCLWFPHDARPLKWVPQDGFENLVDRVHRHLFYEQHWRRTGDWPTEDAPHGLPPHSSDSGSSTVEPFPIVSQDLQRSVRQWRRRNRSEQEQDPS